MVALLLLAAGWPAGDEVIATARARLGNLAVRMERVDDPELGPEGHRLRREGAAWVLSANTARGALWGAYALAERPREGVSKPYFPVREWQSAAFQANFNLPLGGAFDRPIEEISAAVRRTIHEAPRYGINTLQLMGRAGEGGIDVSWFLDPPGRPRIGYGMERRTEEIRALAREAHRYGLDFLIWDHELVLDFPPETRGVEYPVCFSHPLIPKLLAEKLAAFFTRLPEIDGLDLTFAETRGYNLLDHRGCQCEQCRRTPVEDKLLRVLMTVHEVSRRHGKRLEVRSYNESPRAAAAMRKMLPRIPKDVVIVTKNSIVDFRGLRYPLDPMLGAFPGQQQAMELTALPEGSGYGYIPALLGGFYAEKARVAVERGLSGFAIRTDYHLQYAHATAFNDGPAVMTFGTPNDFNVFAASRLAWDPRLDMDALWREWTQQRYGKHAAAAERALRRSAEISEGIFFVKGFSLLTHLNMVPHLATIDQELDRSYLTEFFPENAAYRRIAEQLKSPSEATVREILAEKDRAAEMARHSRLEVEAVAPDLARQFRVAENAAVLWREIARVYFTLRRKEGVKPAVDSLLAEARRIEKEQGRRWPVYPAARGITAYEFAAEALGRAARR